MKEFQDGYNLFFDASSLRMVMLLIVASALNYEFNDGLKTMIVNRSPDMHYKNVKFNNKECLLESPTRLFRKNDYFTL
jgi:hypothetical protein